MAKKNLDVTPRYMIKHAVRLIWMRSRERRAALKRDDYTCQACHRKQSKAKGREFAVECHHCAGIDWEQVIDYIQRNVLQSKERLVTLCPECHDREEKEANPEEA